MRESSCVKFTPSRPRTRDESKFREVSELSPGHETLNKDETACSAAGGNRNGEAESGGGYVWNPSTPSPWLVTRKTVSVFSRGTGTQAGNLITAAIVTVFSS